MSIKKVFKNHLQSCRFIFKDGHEAAFVNGIFYTDVAEEIKELEREITRGHQHLYIDPTQVDIDTDQIDPFAEIKRKAVEEYLEAQKVAINPARDLGTTVQEPIKPASSATVAAMAAGSASGAVAAPISKK